MLEMSLSNFSPSKAQWSIGYLVHEEWMTDSVSNLSLHCKHRKTLKYSCDLVPPVSRFTYVVFLLRCHQSLVTRNHQMHPAEDPSLEWKLYSVKLSGMWKTGKDWGRADWERLHRHGNMCNMGSRWASVKWIPGKN